MKRLHYSLFSVLSILLFWQISVSISQVPKYLLPAPSDVIISYVNNWELIVRHLLVTLTGGFLGLIFGIFFGFLTALYLERSKTAILVLRPILVFSQAIPVFALAPLLTLWLGYGMFSKVVMAILIIYFPVTSSFYDGLSKIPISYIDLAKIMGSTQLRCLIHVKIPGAMQSLFSGIKLASVYAPIGAVIGEWVGSSEGLGYLMLLANGRVQIDLMFASLITLGFLTISLYGIVSAIGNRLLRHY